MIDIQKAEEVLKKYIQNYDDTNGRIKIKKIHIFHVAENAKQIAQSLKLAEEDCKLAELIGLLHDIGRFEQVKRYHTFADKDSIDHAELGLEILFQEGVIREFLTETTYDKIIYLAIQNHNKKEIAKEIEGKALLYCQIIRDADKLDIYEILSTQKIKDAVWFPADNLEKEEITDIVYQDFIQHRKMDYKDIKTNIDCLVSWMGYIYDIYFPYSFARIKQKQYINTIIDRIDYQNEETKQRIEEMRKVANTYLEEKIREK